jgi:hypothetical protein
MPQRLQGTNVHKVMIIKFLKLVIICVFGLCGKNKLFGANQVKK